MLIAMIFQGIDSAMPYVAPHYPSRAFAIAAGVVSALAFFAKFVAQDRPDEPARLDA